jgi:hypothetical protein
METAEQASRVVVSTEVGRIRRLTLAGPATDKVRAGGVCAVAGLGVLGGTREWRRSAGQRNPWDACETCWGLLPSSHRAPQ